MSKEIGIITGVRWEKVNNILGYFIQFKGKNKIIQLIANKEYMWISAKLAKDLGFPVDEGSGGSYAPPANYEDRIIGKEIELKD